MLYTIFHYVIRDAEMFFFPEKPLGPIFANRGLSGIDGNIATCSGIAQIQPVIAIIGDQTMLHDLYTHACLPMVEGPVPHQYLAPRLPRLSVPVDLQRFYL